MQVVLKKGESVKIGLLDADGVITVKYGEKRLQVHADMPDSTGREKIIYEEIFVHGKLPAPVEDKTFQPSGEDPDENHEDPE